MHKNLYTIFDEKAKSIGPVFLAASHAEAERSVVLGVKGNEVISRYPADFSLLCLGDIDSQSGRIVVPEIPILVCKVDELLMNAGAGAGAE